MEKLLKEKYGFDVISAEKSSVGAGSDTYFVSCKGGKYVVKFPSVSEINNPEAEPKLCVFLIEKGLRVCEFVKNRNGEYISSDKDGRLYHVQKFISGRLYDWNTAPDWLLREQAETLGKIHSALENYNGLPTGIGADFFKYMTPENALKSYENSFKTAHKNGDSEIERDLLYRIELMKRFPKFDFDMERLTLRATHGDYFISQLLCGENEINAVIDWTTACIHPAVWEIMRSYVYAAPECSVGEINVGKLSEYFRSYRRFAKLNEYDLEKAAALFYYQIAVCDYYGQYYGSAAGNREIYLRQAVFSTKLMRWFEKNLDKCAEALKWMK